MNKMKKLLSVVLAVVLAFSALSVLGSAAKTSYQTVENLTAMDAYSPYGQVTRLSLEERTSIVFDALDNLLAKTNINMGKVFDVLGLSVTIDLTSIDRLCYSFDTIKSTFNNTLAGIAMAIVNLGILESLNVDTWATGMTRAGTAQFTILSEILEFLSNNTNLVNQLFSKGLDLGIVSLGGDMSKIEDIIMNLPGFIKGLVYPKIERWDDTLADIKMYDDSIAGKSGSKGVEEIANIRVKALFNDDMSITTLKYDANGNMTSEHTNWLATATGSAAPGTPSDSSPRCYYQFSSTTPGSVMTVYHIVDAKEAKDLAKDNDETNNVAEYNYFKEEQTFVMSPEVEGSSTYVWKATDEWNNSWSLKWYNDDSQFLPGFSGDEFDLQTMSLADLLYTFIPDVFANMAPVVLNGSVKKALAGFLGASFTYVGQGGPEADDAVMALADSSNEFFTREQGDYLWEWSDYAVINGNHYYRFEDQIFAGDISQKNNYFDIINWDYEITGDFMNEFVPANGGSVNDTLLMNFNDFLIKVANEALKDSAATVDAISGFEAQWTKPALTAGSNDNLVANIKAIAQAVIGLAPQHVFGSDWATNERCYVELMLDTENDVVLTGIAAHLVNMLMPSVSLPGKSDLKDSGAKVGAILAAVVREFAAYLVPEYNFDALIYTDFGTTEADPVKSFVTGKDSEYWFDVILTMGINVGFEYLRAFADMGEGTDEWNAFVAATGYKVDGGVYTEADLKLTESVNQWESMVDYILDWGLATDKEWCWAMGNLVNVDGEINLSTIQDPWKKLDSVLNALLPVDEILNVTATDCETELEQLLRYDLILAIVDLRWDDLLDLVKVPEGFVRNANVLDQLATKLKGIVNFLFQKVGNSSDNFALIPSVITDFDTLANQNNLKTMIVNLVGALYNAGVTDGGARTLLPFLNFLLGWKTDPQEIKAPEIWTSFRDGNDYAFQYNVANGGNIDSATTLIKVLNNSAGMLETHRNSSVTDHAYDIQIKSVTSDATTNTLSFNYGDGLVSPYETLDIKIGGTYRGEEAATITIAYDYVGKDGQPIGGTQYTSLTILFSNQYEDSNTEGRKSNDDDEDYTGIDPYKRYVFTENIYETMMNYTSHIYWVKPTIDLSGTDSKKFQYYSPYGGASGDCDSWTVDWSKGTQMTGTSAQYFAYDQTNDWPSQIKEGVRVENNLYTAKAGVTAETEFPYGTYDGGHVSVKYGSAEKEYEVDFIYYNDYDIYDIYLENQYNGYNANQGVAADIYNEYNEAWKLIVYGATYPMMTEAAGHASTDYVATIQPYIPDAIERFEAAKEAYETALAEAQASGSAAALPAYVEALRAEIEDDFMNGKEINFQDYEFYEYFSYDDEKQKGEELYRSYLAPKLMDKYYIVGSGISEAELDLVVEDEENAFIASGILASREENKQEDIDAAQAAHDEWKQPINTKLIVDDMTSRIAYYKQFLNEANREDADHLYFLEKEIAHVEAQGLDSTDYTAASWANYAEALAVAKDVAAGNDEFASFNSRIYDVKYNLMVAYKQLLSKEASLIEAGGTAALEANVEIANAIFESLAAGDGAYTLKEGVDANEAYAALISALGYEYQAVYSENDTEVQNGTKAAGDLKYNADGSPMMFELYADSAHEYTTFDRPNNQNNQAKVNAANTKLEAAIANFETAEEPAEPNTLVLNENAPFEAIIDTVNCGDYTGAVYGFDTLGWNDNWEVDGTIADFVTTAYGDDYLEVVVGDAGVETTGTVINVLDEEGNIVESYVYIYFGDIDMDGNVGAGDAMFAEDYEMLYEGFDTLYQFMAGDLDGDAMPGSGDAMIMADWEMLYEGMPLQADVGAMASEITYEIF